MKPPKRKRCGRLSCLLAVAGLAGQLIPAIAEQAVPLLVARFNPPDEPDYGHPYSLMISPRVTPGRKLPGWDQGQFQPTLDASNNSSPAISGSGNGTYTDKWLLGDMY